MNRRLPWRPRPKPFQIIRESKGHRRERPPRRTDRRDLVPPDVRLFVWNRDGGCCRTCGSAEQLEFDHVISRAWGGSNSAANIELLCQQCNRRKGVRLNAPNWAQGFLPAART